MPRHGKNNVLSLGKSGWLKVTDGNSTFFKQPIQLGPKVGNVFLGDASGATRPDDPKNQGVKMVNQLAGGDLIARAHPFEAASQVERRVVRRHGAMEVASYTGSKTRLLDVGLRRHLLS